MVQAGGTARGRWCCVDDTVDFAFPSPSPCPSPSGRGEWIWLAGGFLARQASPHSSDVSPSPQGRGPGCGGRKRNPQRKRDSLPGRRQSIRLPGLKIARRFKLILEGRRIASGASRGRKVRTPQGAMPRNPGLRAGDTRGRKAECLPTESATETQTAAGFWPEARVKRWGKSPPLQEQSRRHGKPHRVQGQIGNRGVVRSEFRSRDRFRVLAAQTNDSLRSQERRQNSAYSPSKINSTGCRRHAHLPASTIRASTLGGPATPQRSMAVRATTSGPVPNCSSRISRGRMRRRH